MTEDLLRLSGVVAGYGGGDVLQGVESGVPKGSVACIVGPNGAGKSTVLKTISGLLTPRLGEIHLDGERIDRRSAADILGRGISQVPQADALFPSMTVRENVLLGAYIIRRQKALVRERYDQIAELFPIIADRSHQHDFHASASLAAKSRKASPLKRQIFQSCITCAPIDL